MTARLETSAESSFRLEPHAAHRRLTDVALAPARLRAFFASVAAIDIRHLEYVPFMRFIIADRLDEAFGHTLRDALRRIVHDRSAGGFTTGVAGITDDATDLLKFGTAVAHLLGPANFDAMSRTFYTRFTVENTDASDSYLRQAYRDLTLHTDGTFVDDPTDWLLMMKFRERDATGGESRVLHLDDWPDLERFSSDPLGSRELTYRSPPSKNVGQAVRRTTFFRKDRGQHLCFIDQFAYPSDEAEARYLYALSQSLEASATTLPLPPGDLIVLNNGFWAHGRAAFAPHPTLFRELMRQRGVFS